MLGDVQAARGLDRGERAGVVAWSLLAVVAVAAALRLGVRHDYRLYLGGWRLINDGRDPWQDGGALYSYGPLFNGFAPLIRIHTILPKLVFVTTWLGLVGWSMRFAARRHGAVAMWATFALVGLNPLFVVSTAAYGMFDVLVAGLCVGAVLSARRDRDALAGALLAAGILLKVYPVVLVPVLAMVSLRRGSSARRAVRDLALGVGATIAAGLAASWALWGSATTEPFSFGKDRPSALASIFLFLKGRWSPLKVFSSAPDVDWASTPLLAVAALAVLWFLWRWGVELSLGAALMMVVTLTLYRVGHPQFVQTAVVLTVLALLSEVTPTRRLWWAAAVYAGWFGVVQVTYFLTARDVGSDIGFSGKWAWVRDILGLPSFLVAAYLVFELVHVGRVSAARARR